MIIQCKQCRTKFRFDDTQMIDDGIWLRCSRCQHVFFQDNPLKSAKPGMPAVPSSVPEKPASRLAFEPAVAGIGDRQGSGSETLSRNVMEPPKDAGGILPEETDAKRERINFADIEFSQDQENADETDPSGTVSDGETKPGAAKKSKTILLALWALLVIVIVPAMIYYFAFPQMGERYLQVGERAINLALGNLGVSWTPKIQPVAGLIKLQDVRQRMVNNYVIGNLRIVEGYAVNSADFDVSRILLKGTILDAYAVVLGERLVYAGNVLTDEELSNLPDEEIAQRLAVPSGHNHLNEKIAPNGRIPFMIVFTNDAPGVMKTMVKIVNAERLL
ncbi:MAG: zinc-ribbon domain-containing protein [Syntrophaceae bacterium]|jgi:predicted Zn finger-like uncharacterized protein|nr:zinc-ribbon domain-containing protein [Syntrophaceae bacterium]HOC60124.1 DUF3426 domain-containing protein [Smithellaceae bacterium]HQM46435.1 DUF3426 domain-containing protein [Smithellaceae bacterium]